MTLEDRVRDRRLYAPSARPERQVIALALSWPTWGPKRLSLLLAREGIEISTSAVYRLLRRIGLATRRARLGVLEAHSGESAGLLTQRTRDRLRRGELFTEPARSSSCLSPPPPLPLASCARSWCRASARPAGP